MAVGSGALVIAGSNSTDVGGTDGAAAVPERQTFRQTWWRANGATEASAKSYWARGELSLDEVV